MSITVYDTYVNNCFIVQCHKIVMIHMSIISYDTYVNNCLLYNVIINYNTYVNNQL